MLGVVAGPIRAVTRAIRAATGAAGWLVDLWRQADAFVSALGAIPRILSPRDHDHLLAFISHLPQLTVSALMHVVGEAAREDGLSLSGRGLQDTTRLASSPADIWKEVCATNPDEIGSALDGLISVLRQMRSDLQTGKSIDDVFESANLWREALLSGKSDLAS